MPTLLFSHRIALIAQLLASRKIVGDLLLITLLSVVAAAATQPNIVLILADDMSWVGTSVNMDPDRPDSKSDYYQTPHLSNLHVKVCASLTPMPHTLIVHRPDLQSRRA